MRISLLLSALFLLASCGFEPIHGAKGRQSTMLTDGVDLSSVGVTVDRTRLGQLLKAEISDLIHPRLTQTRKRYQLAITLEESKRTRFINPDGTPSRGDYVYTSSYTLTDLSKNRVLDQGTLERISSYNVADTADYATFVMQEDARRRGIIELARSYALRLINLKLDDPA